MNDAFPNLAREGFVETSPATEAYNCIAWAAGQCDAFWWPDRHDVGYWPAGSPRAETLNAFVRAFETLGYVPCEHGNLEEGFEKIAFYARDGFPKHAARQLPDGKWTSKLGGLIDITHTLRGVEGPVYGQVAAFMKRMLSTG